MHAIPSNHSMVTVTVVTMTVVAIKRVMEPTGGSDNTNGDSDRHATDNDASALQPISMMSR